MKPIILFVAGPAACGKGTLCKTVLAAMPEVLHYVEMSSLLKPLFNSNPEYREMAGRGELLPVQVVSPVFKSHFLEVCRRRPIPHMICDGPGRKEGELRGYFEMLSRHPEYEPRMVFLTATKELVQERAQKRTEQRQARGLAPRPEDLNGFPSERYELHRAEEVALKRCADEWGVRHFDLDAKHPTETLAVDILKVFHPFQSHEALADMVLAGRCS